MIFCTKKFSARVYVTLNDVAAQPRRRRYGALKVNGRTRP